MTIIRTDDFNSTKIENEDFIIFFQKITSIETKQYNTNFSIKIKDLQNDWTFNN